MREMTGSSRRSFFLKQRTLRFVWPALLLCVASCAPITPEENVPLFNFHVLDPGRAYRSAQPDNAGLREAVARLKLKTVINLRGPNPGKPWYDVERAVCEELGITLIDLPTSASRLPSADLLDDLLTALRTAETPFLLHCESGADRTGAAAALYRIVVLGHDKSDAMAKLSPFMLHFRYFTPCPGTLVELFEPTPEWLDWYAANVGQIVCVP
ncbi:MAG TPA: dual specificity protein phosphatase family protein [Phycisphaerae bacterium]|nr:dual specificity protein phosphatase family protein [Phycisphaerae bacterium]